MGDLALFEGAALPAHIQAMQAGVAANSDLSEGVGLGFPIISYKGKTWALSRSGTREVILRDGEPLPSLELVIVKANPHISKVFYPNGFVEGSDDKPTCYSNNGKTPALDSEAIQNPACGTCPHNQFGSRITENGAKGKACADSRRLAVATPTNPEDLMLLRVPAASLKTLVAYGNDLTRRNTPYSALVTKIGFDHNLAYPSLTFKPVRWLDETEFKAISAQIDSDLVSAILAVNEVTEALSQTGNAEIAGQRPTGATLQTKTAVTPAEVEQVVAQAEAKVEAKVEAAPAKTDAPKTGQTTGGFGGGSSEPEVVQAAEPTPAATKTEVLMSSTGSTLADLLRQLDDEPA